MVELPSGTVTFLFTDLVTSTRLWEEHPEAMRAALERHDAIVRGAIESHHGYVFSTGGDGFGAAFGRVSDALSAATDAQGSLATEDWSNETALSARIGVHTGETAERDGDYFGPVVNRAARLMAVAHGGQVVCSRATADLAPSTIPLRSLGEHRLRDLAAPQEVFQVGGGTFPPLRSLDAYPTNLPVQLTSFVGRERELKLIAESLRVDRLVTLTGTGGVGKTRLALQASAEAVPAFPDGAWLCEIAAAPDPESMLGLVATTLGSVPREQTSLVDGIAEFVGNKRILLILDNCEHLLDVTAELCEHLLFACRQVEILATSREALDVAGERVVRLRSLEVPELDAGVEELTQVPASRLFIDRADAAGAGLELSKVDAQAVAEVCRRLDGIPLAIELAAARTIAMSPSEIAARLDERFRLLTGGRRAAVERHQTLRATIDWSYSVLTPTEQRVFDCLGAFPTSFDAEAAQAVSMNDEIEAWDVVDALRSLVAKSLLTAEHTADGTTRYQMLESLRHYARERLELRGAADQVRRSHAQHFASLVDKFIVGVQGTDEQVWHARFRLEFENLRTAVLWGLDSVEEADGELALHILAASTGGVQTGAASMYQLTGQAIDRARHGNPRYRATVLAGASLSAFYRGDLAHAAELAHEALADGIGPDTPGRGVFPLIHRLMFARSADVPALIADGQVRLEELGASDWELAGYLGSAASLAVLRGHLEVARTDSARSLSLARTLHSPAAMATASDAYALAWWQAESETALEVLENEFPAFNSVNNEPLLHRALALAAQLHAARGDAAAALERLGTAIASTHANGDRQGMATVLPRGVVVLHIAVRESAAVTFAGVVTDGVLKGLRPVPQHEMSGFGELLDDLSASLGPDRYGEAFSRGTTMSYNEIAAFAADAASATSL